MLEEERLQDGDKAEAYYKNRLIHVFIKPGKNVEIYLNSILKAMSAAVKAATEDEEMADHTMQNSGLQCLKCQRDGKEGYITGSYIQCPQKDQECVWKCSEDPSHTIKYKKTLTEELSDDQALVIRRYASAVSIIRRLQYY